MKNYLLILFVLLLQYNSSSQNTDSIGKSCYIKLGITCYYLNKQNKKIFTEFQYNHSRILSSSLSIGFTPKSSYPLFFLRHILSSDHPQLLDGKGFSVFGFLNENIFPFRKKRKSFTSGVFFGPSIGLFHSKNEFINGDIYVYNSLNWFLQIGYQYNYHKFIFEIVPLELGSVFNKNVKLGNYWVDYVKIFPTIGIGLKI
jgi:hypothetical protein